MCLRRDFATRTAAARVFSAWTPIGKVGIPRPDIRQDLLKSWPRNVRLVPTFCDDRCTNAKGKSCNCECGGANHGGFTKAVDYGSRPDPKALTDKGIKDEIRQLKKRSEHITDELRIADARSKKETELFKESASMERRYDALEKELGRRDMEKPGKKESAAAREAMGVDSPTAPKDEAVLHELDKFDLGGEKMVDHLVTNSDLFTGKVDVASLKRALRDNGRLTDKAEKAIDRAVAKAAKPPKAVVRLEEMVLSDRVPEDLETEAKIIVNRNDGEGAREFLAELKRAGFLD